MEEKNCKHCGKKIKNCYNTQKYHEECFKKKKKEYMKEYSQKPEVKKKKKEYMKKKYFAIKENWEILSDEEQLELMNRKAKEILSNQSPPVRTSPNGYFSNEKEHNKRYAVRSVALTHPKIPSESFAYLNIK